MMAKILSMEGHLKQKIIFHNDIMMKFCSSAAEAINQNLLGHSRQLTELACHQQKLIKEFKNRLRLITRSEIIYTTTTIGEKNYGNQISSINSIRMEPELIRFGQPSSNEG
jgi:hypothetical protein